jgi:uncharacterized protein
MKRRQIELLLSSTAGVVFGVGLAISGMTKPEKVLGFLDVFGAWDASLAFVMAGAIGVHALAYRWTRGRTAPLFADTFAVPHRRDIDVKLLAGAALFGVGWGLSGFCPGPAIVSLASGSTAVGVFVASMLLGSVAAMKLETFLKAGQSGAVREQSR